MGTLHKKTYTSAMVVLFEPVTASLAMWLATNPRHLRPKRVAAILRREVVRRAVLDEISEPVCSALNLVPSNLALLCWALLFLMLWL